VANKFRHINLTWFKTVVAVTLDQFNLRFNPSGLIELASVTAPNSTSQKLLNLGGTYLEKAPPLKM